MMQSEFESLTGVTITPELYYGIIEPMYMATPECIKKEEFSQMINPAWLLLLTADELKGRYTMKQDPKEVVQMLNAVLSQIRPCNIAKTTIIEDIEPESLEFVIRSAIQCIDQMGYKTCKQQLSTAYGIMVSDLKPKPIKIKPRGTKWSAELKRMMCMHGGVCMDQCTPDCEDYDVW